MKLSVIIPIYNGEQFLNRCLESIIRSIDDSTEVIMIDDGSNDRTRKLCIQFIKEHPNYNLYYEWQENAGVGSARNKGLKRAKGEWIYFLDVDDYLDIPLGMLTDRLQHEQSTDLVIFCMRLLTPEKIAPFGLMEDAVFAYDNEQQALLQHFRLACFHEGCNKFYRNQIITQNDLSFELNYQIGEDFLFNIHYLLHCKKVRFGKEMIYVYDKRNAQASTVTLHPDWFIVNRQALCLLLSYTKFSPRTRFYQSFLRYFIQQQLEALLISANQAKVNKRVLFEIRCIQRFSSIISRLMVIARKCRMMLRGVTS